MDKYLKSDHLPEIARVLYRVINIVVRAFGEEDCVIQMKSSKLKGTI